MATSPLEMNLADVAALLRQKQLSPVELTEQALNRTALLNPQLNALLTVTAEAALAEARQAESEINKGEYRGPLHGVPVTVKDLMFTAGVRTTCGSKIMANFVPDYDATVVKKLREAEIGRAHV